MNEIVNGVGVTVLVTFFVCAQVYPRQTAIVTIIVFIMIFGVPFIPR